MTASDVLAWLSARQHLLTPQPIELSRCASCRYAPAPHAPSGLTSDGGPLAVLGGPTTPYALCVRCLGRDAGPRASAPTAIPPPRRSTKK